MGCSKLKRGNAGNDVVVTVNRLIMSFRRDVID